MGIAVMIVSYLIFFGFKSQIQDKLFSLAAHIRITKFDLNNSYEERPISANSTIYERARSMPEIDRVQRTASKAGLLKTDSAVMGIVMKGVTSDFDSVRFKQHLTSGHFITLNGDEAYAKQVLLSQRIANQMRLTAGDSAVIYFIQDPPRFRKVRIQGIYDTGIEEFDDILVYGDLGLIQRLNSWGDTLIGSFEIFVKDFSHLDKVFEEVYAETDYDKYVERVTDKYQHYFDWFIMLNRNVVIFMGIILSVAMFNMISIMFIMIMERTSMIGTLKSFGATNGQVRNIFLKKGMKLVLWGLFYGNLLAICFGLAQKYLKIIPLDYETYYMHAVPIKFDWTVILLLNCLVLVISLIILLVPTAVISRISPIKAIRFD